MQVDISPGSSNLVKFRREFEALYQGVDQQVVWDRIMEFYATTFDNVHDVMRRNEPLYRSVVYLRERGHRVLLTTNPVFPQLATYKRLAWAGFSPDAFEYVSTSGRYRDLPRDRLRDRRCGVIGGGPRLGRPRLRALGPGKLLSLEANHAVRRHGEHGAPCHNDTPYVEVGQSVVQTLPRGSLVP